MANVAQRVALKMLRTQLAEIQQKIGEIKRNCKHIIIEVGAEPQYGWHGSALCEDCDVDFGWWCPNSPDHVCHYITHEIEGYLLTARAVELVDGTEHIIHDYQGDPEYENYDNCVFCHDPDERE